MGGRDGGRRATARRWLAGVVVLGAGLALTPSASAQQVPTAQADGVNVLTVSKTTDLVNGETVTVTGTGWPANAVVGFGMCDLVVDDGGDCDLGTAVTTKASAAGTFTKAYEVATDVVVSAGSFSCIPNRCSISGSAFQLQNQNATPVPVSFRELNKLSVSKTAGLVDGETVTVTGSGWPADALVGFGMCNKVVDSGGDCDLGVASTSKANASGAFTKTYVVHSGITTVDDGAIDCVPDRCSISGSAFQLGLSATPVPVTFAQLASDPVTDFDGDGLTDLSVFRPTGARWYHHGTPTSTAFGAAGDVPVPADYDGDGDTDRAVFRPSQSRWYVQGGATTQLGTTGDIPVPADYDGDGDTDLAVFRPSTGRWYVLQGGTVTVTAWGTNGDLPVPADYDGDGDADLTVFRPSSGRWYVKGGATTPWGIGGDLPVPADYDGDGDADLAVFRPSTGRWYVKGGATTPWGTDGDIPVVGEYDGTPGADLAIYRPSVGKWYVAGGPTTAYGTAGDIPLVKRPSLP